MKSDALRSPVSLSCWVVPVDSGAPLEPGFVDVRFGEVPGEYTIRERSRLVTVTLKAPRQTDGLGGILKSGRAKVATVDQVAPDGSAALVTLRLFNGAVVEIGDVDVGIDDYAFEAARRLLRLRRADLDRVAAALTEICTFSPGLTQDDSYFLLSAGAAASRDFDTAEDIDNETSEPIPAVPEVDRAFSIQGDGVRIAVAQKQVTQDEQKYLATRLNSSLGGDPDGSLRLARGRLTFSDFTRTGRIRALAAGTMAKLTETSDSYLRKWDEYGALEGQMLLDRARRIRALSWSSAEQMARGGSGVQFFFADPLPAGIGPGDMLEFWEEVPDYLSSPEMTWAEYSVRFDASSSDGKQWPDRSKRGQEDGADENLEAGASAKVLSIEERSLVLDIQVPPEKAGLALGLSLRGEIAQIERRMEARRLILEGRSANPMLGVLIEENGEPPEPSHRSATPPLTGFVRRKVFSHDPTPRQIEAIDIALNTPDLALIQGPPGTGKTTVIAAIVERLNELADKGRPIQGEVLISAFQHDAIENMMARLTVNSLPVPKFGRRSGKVEIGDRNAENLQRWCGGIAARLREKNPGLRVAEKLREAQARCQEYVLAPSLENAVGTIDAFLNLPDGRLSAGLVARARALRERLEHERGGRAIESGSDLLVGLWSLRATAEGFLDDGPAMAQSLLNRIGAELQPDALDLLSRAASWMVANPPPFLHDLRRLKGDLVEWYRPNAAFRIDKPRRDVLEIVKEAEQEFLRGTTTAKSRADWVLAEFLHELESNPVAAQRAVEEYGFAFAATCQASRGRAITQRKKKAAQGLGPRDYDTVIIDEAARSSPLDLLIPMSQARRRIILVGDHRQLPHMINEEIARTLEDGDGPDERTTADQEADFVRHSMFQYLLSRLKQLEKRDHIRRWVTLDQQFRMHPTLGDFVSHTFYRIHDEAEAFRSPLPARHFIHELPGIPEVPALWLDVPSASGEEEKKGTSRCRGVEARIIASWIKHWIDTPAGQKLSFGIISFYSAQVDEVFAALSAHDLARREPDGWQIEERYQFRPVVDGTREEERLRVATVDSFQGMEFDVVFLSMVRSRGWLPPRPADAVGSTKWERGVYGHLTSPNRLCVSMSRQKRLLVVVGDKAMVGRDEAKTAVPGLAAFLALCHESGQVRNGEAGYG